MTLPEQSYFSHPELMDLLDAHTLWVQECGLETNMAQRVLRDKIRVAMGREPEEGTRS